MIKTSFHVMILAIVLLIVLLSLKNLSESRENQLTAPRNSSQIAGHIKVEAPVVSETATGCGGSCHGNPPSSAPHQGIFPNYNACYHCHTLTVDSNGDILPWGFHKDGFVQ